MRRSFAIIFVMACCTLSCNTTKKLQDEYGFSDACKESYELFSNLIVRHNTGLLTIKVPIQKNYLRLLESHDANAICWNNKIPESAIIELLGVPHKRGIGSRTGAITISYYIRTQGCIDYQSELSSDENCGVFEFTFSKEGNPTSSVFYAINPS